jgi:Predicted O-linked N-acetylglucosamine transferase, SPINDLY family
MTTLLLLSRSARQGGLQRSEINDSDESAGDIDVDAVYAEVNRLIRASQRDAAREYVEGLLAAHPGNRHVLLCYSRACVFIGAWQEALRALCQLLGHYLSSRNVWFDLVTGLQKTRDHFYARKILQMLLRIDDKNADLWYALATSHHSYGDMAFAEKCCREALRYQQMNARHLAMMGIILSDNQKIDEARYFLEKAIQQDGGSLDYMTSLLFVMTHDYSVTAEALKAKHLEYGRLVDNWVKQQGLTLALNNSKDPQRKLRVGFVSGDLRKHPVTNFLLPFWDAIDRTQFDLVGYSTGRISDFVTEHLRSTSALWRDVDQLNSAELAKQINADGIDILFDLAGHTTDNRLATFALRPAPVQISWIGYPGTTGISNMDYLLLKSTLRFPDDLESHLVEKLSLSICRRSSARSRAARRSIRCPR